MVKYLGSSSFTSQKGVVPTTFRPFAVVSSMSFARPFAFLFFAGLASAAESANSPWVVSVTEENDKFTPTNKDRYYTQGLKVSVNRGDNVFFSVTQEINTPSDTLNPPSVTPPYADLPYSGALYLGWGYGRVLERGGRRDSLFSIEAKLGVIGPSAGGATVQNKFHDLIGSPQSVGWGSQLPDELLINLDGEFRHRFDLDGPDRDTRDLIARALPARRASLSGASPTPRSRSWCATTPPTARTSAIPGPSPARPSSCRPRWERPCRSPLVR
jgi:hypothetical protein